MANQNCPENMGANHCRCWWDGKECCWCKAPPATPADVEHEIVTRLSRRLQEEVGTFDEWAQRQQLKAEGKLTEEQQQRFIDLAISKAIMLPNAKIVCTLCGRVIKQTWWGKLSHWLRCW